MRARLDTFHSPDVDDLRGYKPGDPQTFGFYLEFEVGSDDGEGTDIFGAMVCTPQWLLHRHSKSDVVSGYHKIIVFEYDYERLWAYIDGYCNSVVEDTWEKVAARIGRLGKWEFADMNRGLLGP